MNNVTKNRLVVAALCSGIAAILLSGQFLDRSPVDIDAAVAADLEDAKLAAQHFERDYRACKKALGPTADLIQIEGSDHYVCRQVAIEPTPVEILRQYAKLGAGK